MPFKSVPSRLKGGEKKRQASCSPGRSAGCHLVLMEIYLCILPAGLTRWGRRGWRGGTRCGAPHAGGPGGCWRGAGVRRRVGNVMASGRFALKTTYFKSPEACKGYLLGFCPLPLLKQSAPVCILPPL